MPFKDRIEAGRSLAARLKQLGLKDPVVIALPRGGVPVGYQVAKELGCSLEILVVRKVGMPSRPEYGIGAITEEGHYWINEELARATGASPAEVREILETEHQEVERRVKQYRGSQPLVTVQGKTVIVVDDGLATGVTARVASHYLKSKGAARVILAAPICSPDTARFLRRELDEVICLEEPSYFFSVGQFYDDFSQTTDDEVLELLARPRPLAPPAASVISKNISIHDGPNRLPGELTIPEDAHGVVLFAHGSGSGRLSPRNQQVAKRLNSAGLGTLLFDLLTDEESLDRRNVFDIPFLASRLIVATQWARRQAELKDLPVGYFGASTGGGAALWAAALLGDEISAVVSRGGRPDLARARLGQVTAPTLLIVGALDTAVIPMNEEAMKYLTTVNLILIPGATHLFEEPGTLELVADEAVLWFTRHLEGGRNAASSVA